MYACVECGTRYEKRVKCCSVCFEHNTVVSVPIEGKTFFVDRERRLVSAKELAAKGVVGEVIDGFEFFGLLPSAAWTILFYGQPGLGKSSLALRLCVALNKKVIFFAVEEGLGPSLIKKLQDWEVRTEKILISDAKNERELRQDLVEHDPDIVVIDSVTALGATLKHRRTIWIAQSTKDCGFRGKQELAHDADIVAQIFLGEIEVEKNRFANPGRFLL